MGKEIERKFLVINDKFMQNTEKTLYRQGYLCSNPKCTIRVRVAGDQGYITVKGPTKGATRDEFEYPIPAKEAEEMLAVFCEPPLIEKERYRLEYEGFVWEVDVFKGENEGLVIAEIELPDEDASFEKPEWIGKEVTGNKQYYNSHLIKNPYKNWIVEK